MQVFNIVMKAAINKAVAILLGTEGMGVISLYNSAVNMLRTVAGLGIPQSAVRDVLRQNATCERLSDYNRYKKLSGLQLCWGL